MAVEIKIPSPGESISEVEIASWFVETGDFVERDQEIGEVESEKATLPLIAEESGEIEILKKVGETAAVGEVVCTIDTSKKGKAKEKETKTEDKQEAAAKKSETTQKDISSTKEEPEKQVKESEKTEERKAADEKSGADKSVSEKEESEKEEPEKEKPEAGKEPAPASKATPVAKKMMEENGLSIEEVLKGLRKISRKDVEMVLDSKKHEEEINFRTEESERKEQRTSMSNLRKKLSQRLVAVKNETAMLTTFNEADMSRIMDLRKKYQSAFVEKHGIKLGFMSFFTKAASLALKEFTNVNSRIEDDEIVTPSYTDIGIAVQTDKGLMVPVIRNTQAMGLADIEKAIMELAGKARKNRISIDDMAGGTFTITNGGVFGSMMSTPILNPPQSAILGMHNIIERPVAINGQVVIRPMMYLALSYDHRLVDGRDSVSFLVKIKEYIESPEKLLMGGIDAEKKLLGL